MTFALQSRDNGTFYTGMTTIGPCFGGTAKDAVRFETALKATGECGRHWALGDAIVVDLSPRALSLTRPWPWCFTAPIDSPKGVENRDYTRKGKPSLPPVCTYRGELYLHAAQSWDPKVGRKLLEAGLVDETQATILSDKSQHPAGVIVARCRAVGHIEPVECTMCRDSAIGSVGCMACGGRGDPTYHGDRRYRLFDVRWWAGGYGLVVADVQAIEPVPCKGKLGVWKVLPDVAAQLRMSA